MKSNNHPAAWEAEWICRNKDYYRDCLHASMVIQQIVGRRSLATARMLTGLPMLKLANYDGDLVTMVAGRAYHEPVEHKSGYGRRLAEIVITCPNLSKKAAYSDILNQYREYKDQIIDDVIGEKDPVEKAVLGMFDNPVHNDILRTVFSEFEIDELSKKIYRIQGGEQSFMLITTGVWEEPFCIELYLHH